jgi:PII-like signaling protein
MVTDAISLAVPLTLEVSMSSLLDAILIRVFTSETTKFEGKPLYELIVQKARELNLAGATVMRGILGFGAHNRIHTAKLLTLSEDLPIIVEIVDTEENVNRLMPFLDSTIKEGLITLEKIKMVRYRKEDDR